MLDVAGGGRVTGGLAIGGGGGSSAGVYSYQAVYLSTSASVNYSLVSGLTICGMWSYIVNGNVNTVIGLIQVYRAGGAGGAFSYNNNQILGGGTQITFTGSTTSYSFQFYANNAQTFMECSMTLLSGFTYL